MSRLSDAWAALCGRLPVREVDRPVTVEKTVEVTKPVPVGDGVVTVFVAESRAYNSASQLHFKRLKAWRDRNYGRALSNISPYGRSADPHTADDLPKEPVKPEWSGRIYLTCAQAFAEIGEDADLTPRKALLHDGKAYILGSLTEHEIQPKPKRAKGAKA